MQNVWRRIQYGAAILITAAIIGGCGGNFQQVTTEGGTTATSTQATGIAGSGAAGGSEVKEVKIGYLANIVMPQPLVGLQNGEFEKLVPGVKFTSQDYAAGPDVMKALRAGTVDIAYTGPFPPMKAYANDKDMVLLAGSAKGGTELMVGKNSPIKTIKDLKGKVVAINQEGSTVDALVRYNLLQAGLNPDKDVTMIEIKPAQQADALKRGEAAAVAAPAPWPSVVAINGNGRPLLNWKQILSNGDYLAGVAFTTKKFASNNPNFIKQYVAAHQAITDRLNKDRTKGNAEVLSAWSKVTRQTMKPEVAKAAFATITFTTDAEQKDFERDMDIAHKGGILREKGDLNGFIYQQ